MVSLKKYTKEQILTEGNSRFKKIASMLDKEDMEAFHHLYVEILEGMIHKTLDDRI